ncbi:hypothetical protein PMPD1_0011 [Paramixta manurensis]|uniref:DUF3289 family protein n=1 Tax=Paramixta manurensis TaxID=2740817 RepID=A0A6M8U890_9GAMM|nr:hypothetical protein PMPD1_0011 [Erwiniaceae bacterium PD-1]
MSLLHFPFKVFTSANRLDDYGADDMRYGDLDEMFLKRHLNLVDISSRVNPYTLTALTAFNQPQSRFYGMHGHGTRLSRQACAEILFDEFRHLAGAFSWVGPYRHLILRMIEHMQKNNGAPYYDIQLNRALKEQIVNDGSEKNSSLLILKNTLLNSIDWDKKSLNADKKKLFQENINNTILPKFIRQQDKINGLGITVHDTWATQITIKSLRIEQGHYHAVVHYKVQDHFGLDQADIRQFKYWHFRFFRIWFVLQRYNQFAYKPFITNMEATIEISGSKNESI